MSVIAFPGRGPLLRQRFQERIEERVLTNRVKVGFFEQARLLELFDGVCRLSTAAAALPSRLSRRARLNDAEPYREGDREGCGAIRSGNLGEDFRRAKCGEIEARHKSLAINDFK